MFTTHLQLCSILFNAEDMILVGSSGFFNHTSTSADGCCLYIIMHYGMLWWDWGIGSVPRDGRPEPESFKAVDTYTYSEIHTNSPYICPRMNWDCPYKGWVFVILLVECKWVYWFTSVGHMFVELCYWTSGTLVNCCRWGVVQLPLKCCHILKSWVEMLIALIFAVSRNIFIIIVWSL